MIKIFIHANRIIFLLFVKSFFNVGNFLVKFACHANFNNEKLTMANCLLSVIFDLERPGENVTLNF